MAGYILLVEGNENDEQLTRRILQQNGIRNTVVVAQDGAQAVDILFTREMLPAIVLLDLDVTRIAATEIQRMMRENPRTKGIPVIGVTKPVGLADFVDAVKSAITDRRPTTPTAGS